MTSAPRPSADSTGPAPTLHSPVPERARQASSSVDGPDGAASRAQHLPGLVRPEPPALQQRRERAVVDHRRERRVERVPEPPVGRPRHHHVPELAESRRERGQLRPLAVVEGHRRIEQHRIGAPEREVAVRVLLPAVVGPHVRSRGPQHPLGQGARQGAHPAPAEPGEGRRGRRVVAPHREPLRARPVGTGERVRPGAVLRRLDAVDDHVHVAALEQREQLGERALDVARGAAQAGGEQLGQLGLEAAQMAGRLLEDVGRAPLGVRAPPELGRSRGEGHRGEQGEDAHCAGQSMACIPLHARSARAPPPRRASGGHALPGREHRRPRPHRRRHAGHGHRSRRPHRPAPQRFAGCGGGGALGRGAVQGRRRPGADRGGDRHPVDAWRGARGGARRLQDAAPGPWRSPPSEGARPRRREGSRRRWWR